MTDFKTDNPLALAAWRYFEQGDLRAAEHLERNAALAEKSTKIEHEKAQEKLKEATERRKASVALFTDNLLCALGQPSPFGHEKFAYSDEGELFLVSRPKAVT